MKFRRPDVFISACTRELGTFRQVVKAAVLKLGAHPIEQTDFSLEPTQLLQMLFDLVNGSDAVVHLAGGTAGAGLPAKTTLERQQTD